MTYNYYILVLRWVFFIAYTIPYAGIFQTLREALRGSFKEDIQPYCLYPILGRETYSNLLPIFGNRVKDIQHKRIIA